MAKNYTPVFAIGKYDNILSSIESGTLPYPSYVICTDEGAHQDTLIFVDQDKKIRNIRGFNQDSVIYVDSLPEEDVRTDAFYICGDIGYLYNGTKYVPVLQDISALSSYNNLTDAPITNLTGSMGNEVVLSELDNGTYNVTGQYLITPDDTIYITTRSVLFLVDSDVENKYITKFGTGEIFLYTMNLETGELKEDSYATESWVMEQIKEQDITKLSQLENDVGYITRDDITGIGSGEIAGLFT